MAIIRAVKSGNWSDATVWQTSIPTSADDVYSNTFTVTIDTSPTVLSISNAAASGVTVGGSFVPTNGITLTCTGAGVTAGTSGTACLISSLTTGSSFTINSQCVSNNSGSGGIAVRNTSSGAIIINGACTAGSNGTGSNAHAITNESSGTVTITGKVTGSTAGSGANNTGVLNSSTGTVNVQGNIEGGRGDGTCFGVSNTSSGSITAVGAVFTNNFSAGVRNSGSGSATITGSVTGGASGGFGANNTGIGLITITGNCTGGTLAAGANNASTGTLIITGTCTAGDGAPGVNSANGNVTVNGSIVAVANQHGFTSNSTTAINLLTGPFLTSTSGWNPVYAMRWFWQNTNAPSTYYQVRTANLSIVRSLYTADSVGGNPAITNVRSGTIYGPNSELTGTCAVPAANSVAFGVPVDATTGTAVLTPESVRSAVGLASANLNAQLAAIPTTTAPTAAAIRTEMDSNSTKLANLDATVSSRLASSGYTAPPTVGDIATAVWAAATRTLTTAIDNSATIAAAVWSYATGRTITGGTVDSLTNAPSVPSAATIASQVRTELSTELGRIDVATSTRLAAASYTTPPSAATTATAVRSELATEMGRLDAAVSSRLAPAGTLARVTLTDTTTTLTNAPDVPTEAEIADAVRTELTPELARVANAATTQEVADIIEGALEPAT